MTTILITDLEELCLKVLCSAGLREKDAQVALDHLLENELSGKASHGMVRVVEAANAMKKYGVPLNDPTIETDTGNMVVLNANRQIGVIAACAAMTLGITRAKEHGLALIGVRDYIATTGSMTYYLRRLADAGLIAIMGCNSVAMVAPPGGKTRKIGTNPVGITIPGENGAALIADLGTSAIAYGKLMVMKNKGEDVPEGLLIDKDGKPSTNPNDAYDGAILPLADYKGFALGLMIELLAGPLIGARAVKNDLYDNDGLFMILIDPSKMGHNNYIESISNALQEVKGAPKQPEYDAITIPGERSAQALKEALERGEIDIADKTLSDLHALI